MTNKNTKVMVQLYNISGQCHLLMLSCIYYSSGKLAAALEYSFLRNTYGFMEEMVIYKKSQVSTGEINLPVPLKLMTCPLFHTVTSTVGATPSCPVGATPSRPVGATPSCSVGATPSRPVGATPSRPVGATPSHPVGATPSRPVGATPSRPVGATPSRPVGGTPSGPVGGTPSGPVGGTPSRPVGATPSHPVGATPSRPVGATPSHPVGATPSRLVKYASRPVKHGLRPVHYKTTLAKALSNVLQDSPDLVTFDKLRYLIKNSSASVVSNLRYKKLSKLFRDKLVKQYNKSQFQIPKIPKKKKNFFFKVKFNYAILGN